MKRITPYLFDLGIVSSNYSCKKTEVLLNSQQERQKVILNSSISIHFNEATLDTFNSIKYDPKDPK